MSEILCQWLNQELKVSQTVNPKSFAKAFANGYLIGEVLHKFELQNDFSEFSESRVSSAKINNFSRLEPTLHLLGVQFDQKVANNIITEKPGAATKLVYELYTALQKRKKSGLTWVEMHTMPPLPNTRLQNVKSEALGDQRLSRRRQNEIMAKIQAAIIQIPKPASNRTLKALEAQKMMKKKKETEDVAIEIQKFEELLKKDLQAKESASKASLDTAGQTTADLLNTYSDDEYIKKIQKRLEEDAFAREQREKRRRRLLMDQLIAHEAQEEAYREEQLINRLMRQSQQERRIAVQLMHVRHEKEVLWQNRIFREKQYEERRLKEFQDALDREAALAKQAKLDFEEQAAREREIHEQIAVERAQARYQKHYIICASILDQILDLSTKVADYRMLTNNLIPSKLMHDWKELFFHGKPIYEQASIKDLPAKPSAEQLVELEKRDLLDNSDYGEYKNMVGEWALPEEMVDRLPPSNNCILGHVVHRLIERSLPPQVESTEPELPSFAIKGCILGKTFSGKTTVLKFLQRDFPIQVLSIDTLLQEAIRAFHDNETVHEALPIPSEAKGQAGPDLHGNESQDPQNKLSADSVSYEALPEREDKTTLSTGTSKTPEAKEVKSSDSFSKLTVRAQLGAKSEKMLKKGKSVSDLLLVNILVNAINQMPEGQGWALDGFPMTLNQARLLDEALTGCNRTLVELERKKAQKHALAVDLTATKEVSLPPAALDFVMLLDISDNSSLDRMNHVMAKNFSTTTLHEDINQRVAAKNQDTNDDQNLRDQIQHRITGFLDNWSLLQQWFSEPENILIKINAEVDEESLCQKVKEIFTNEIVKKENKVKKKLEEREAKRKEELALAEPPALPSPLPPPPEPEKEKETHHLRERSKTPPAKGRQPSEALHDNKESLQEGKGKKGEASVKKKGAADKGSPKGKSSGGKVPGKKSPAESAVAPPAPAGPPPPKPGSEEWVYVNEPIPEEIPSFLVPYWELIENSYIDSIKTVLRNLREDWHIVLTFLYETRTSFQQFLRRPDHKQDFVSQWQADFNSLPEDLWDDEETKAEVHQRVNDLRDRLWDICETRKEEAEQERLDIINKSWLQDSVGIMMNHFFSLMQAELNRFQDTKRLLQDYYRAMECKIPMEDKKFTHIPLLQMESRDASESHLRIPLASRISISPDSAVSKSKPKTILKVKIDHSLEKVELNLEADEKLVIDTWQQACLAISHMMAAEIHQRLLEEEKETQPAETKEKSPQMSANKKVTKEPPTQKKADKKEKGKLPSMIEVTSAALSPEEIAEMEKKNELRLKIKEEHLAALQFEEIATQFRLELIKTKALASIEDLVTKVVNVYKLMEKWLGERYLHEMASVEKLTEVARYHIEMSTKIQNQLYLDQEDFFVNGDIKVFPDPPPPIRPPPVEKEENGTLTIEQLDNFRDQFLEIAPKGRDSPDHMSRVTEKQRKARSLDHYLPKRNNQFLKIWLKKFPWLVYDEIPNLMFCGLCRKHGVKPSGGQASLSQGTDSFSSEFLRAHQLSEAHARASLMEATKGSPGNRASSELTVRAMSKVTLGRVENLFRSCHALAKTGRPLGDFIWMCKLDAMKGVDIGPIFRTKKSARTFTYFIAEVERRNLREKLEKSPFFSVISDGLSASSMEKAELVYVQFAHLGKVHCQLVGVQTAEKKDPLSVKIAIEKTLERNLQLELSDQGWAEKLVGFGRDGAPGSEGENSGLALLLREMQPRVLTVYCFAHHLELSYKAVFQSVPLYTDVRDLLRRVHCFYHSCPLRERSLRAVFRGLRLRPVMPARAGGRRWLQGLQAALLSFLKGYPAIVQQLRSTGEGRSDSSRQKAEELLEILLRADIVKFAHFLVDVIHVLSILSHISQNRNSSMADVFATLKSTLEMLRMYQTRPGPKERRVDSVTHFHSNCLKEKGSISDVRNTVLTRLIKRLQGCFRDASQDVVKATVIGSFKSWPTEKNEGIIGNKAFTDILLDLVILNLGTNNLPSSWMHLTRPELQELTSVLTVNSDFVDWRKFLLVASLPWPIALEEELLETLQRFKAVDEEQLGTITFQQYMQAGLWFTGDEDIKVPEDPYEPLPFNRQGHLIEFFFRLFADFEKDPPLLDYTWMLLYFACHPDPVEGVYRALSVATGTRIFQPAEIATVIAEENYSFTNMSPVQEFPETEGNIISEKREFRGERELKEEEIPANANTEKISMETLLQVFRGESEGHGANQPVSALRRQNIYAENFIKVFQDLGAKNLEPIEVALLLKHPFTQDLISSYPDYKIPDIKIILQRSEHVQGSDEERSPSRFMEEKK